MRPRPTALARHCPPLRLQAPPGLSNQKPFVD